MLVPDEVRKSVVFIGIKKDGKFKPRATAFIVAAADHGHQFLHLVTAQHVVAALIPRGKVYCRANLTNGEIAEFELPGDAWTFYPDERDPSDVAVCPFNPEGAGIDYVSIPVTGSFASAATAEVIREKGIGVGEEVFMVGLFRSHYGTEKNVPIVRIGNIAAMREEPVLATGVGFTDAYLVEARSISGLSGSPVFVNIPPFRIVSGKTRQEEGLQFLLLGLVHGHFDIKNLNEDTAADDEADTTRGINTGIGVVIPVEKIIETINDPHLIALRKQIAENNARRHGTTPDVAEDEGSEPPTTADNPRHREDFTALLTAAARKPKRGD